MCHTIEKGGPDVCDETVERDSSFFVPELKIF